MIGSRERTDKFAFEKIEAKGPNRDSKRGNDERMDPTDDLQEGACVVSCRLCGR